MLNVGNRGCMSKYLADYTILILAVFLITAASLASFSISAISNTEKLFTWTKGPVLSRVDYRIFFCGKEVFLEPAPHAPVAKGVGLYKRSKSGSIILDGTPTYSKDIQLPKFFVEVGGELRHRESAPRQLLLKVPTKNGVEEFWSDDTCNGKSAYLTVLHHRVDSTTKPMSVHPRILWKYADYLFDNNYGRVPPGDCLILIFDTEDALKRAWPHCKAHNDAVKKGDLIFLNPVL